MGGVGKNKASNQCHFHIVKGFISNKPLKLTNLSVCSGYGTTSESATGTPSAPSFTLQNIQTVHQLTFNVLVADCEGFLGEFLDDNPQFLAQLRMIIFEADYPKKCDYAKIREMLRAHQFIERVAGHQNVWTRLSFRHVRKQNKNRAD